MAGLLDTTGIENFYNAASTYDFARQNLFRVVSLGGNKFTLNELMYITTTTLPSRAINNVAVPFMGLQFNVPGTANYPNSNGWNVTFRVPQNLSIRKKFENWTRLVFDDTTSSGAYNIPSKDISNQIILSLIDKNGNAITTYTLYGAYCVSTGDMTLDVTTAGEIITQQVTLAYQYWRSN
jgi:hypothetical protein